MRPSPLPLFAAALASAPGLVSPAAAVERPALRVHADHVLGTSLDLIAVGAPGEAAVAARAAQDEIARLEPLLSSWREDGELARLNRTGEAVVSEDLYHVIAAAERWRALTGGAFDGRLGAVEALWREAEAKDALPDPEALERAVLAARAGPPRLDAAARTVALPPGVALALDGLAKGHVIDRALAAGLAAAPGLDGMLVDIGGDLRCAGGSPRGAGWSLALYDPSSPADNAPPLAVREVAGGGALATSGFGPRDRRIGGRRLSPLLDPADGRPVRTLAVAALAPTAMEADALSTALMVMGPGEGAALARRLGMQALTFDGGGALREAPGWTRVAAAPAGAPWPSGSVVTIEYEAPRIAGRKIYPPYMAVWITDQSNRLVRALVLLGDDPNYIDQNFIWWRRHGRGAPAVVDAVSRPTRAPGRYTAVWDGKDNDGKAVPLGRYTVHVEAIREHGGHSYQAMELDLTSGAAVGAEAKASDELGPSRVRFGPRTAR